MKENDHSDKVGIEKKSIELQNCNFAKNILMIIVIIYHSIMFWSGDWFSEEPIRSNSVLPVIAKWMNTFHISVFTLISGYIYYYVRFERNSYTKYKEFIKKKVKRLIIPYIFVAILWVIPLGYIFFRYSVSDVINSFAIGKSPAQLWYLLMLFEVFALFPLFEKLIVKSTIASFAIVGSFWVLGVAGKYFDVNYFQIFTAFCFISYFIVGFKLRQYSNLIRFKGTYAFVIVVLQIIMFVISLKVEAKDAVAFKILSIILDFIVTQLGAVGAFYLLQSAANTFKKRGKVYTFLQKSNMVIYLLHQQIIYFSLWALNGRLNPYTHSFVNFIFAFSVSSILAFILLKFRITSFVLGEKYEK